MTATQNTPLKATPPAAPSVRDVTIVLPCRNEAATVAFCVRDALDWMARRELSGEVLVVDNASRDGSHDVATVAGARVVHESRVGYGAAVRAGIGAAQGQTIIMADADNTYDLTNLDAFYDPIAVDGTHDMVIGNRFATPLEPRAMNLLHRFGNRVLSGLTRARTGTDIRDVHCGLRAFSRDALEDLPVWSTGMEFATHMLAHAHAEDLRVTQTATTLRPPVRGRKSHLRPLRDGLRHLAAIART